MGYYDTQLNTPITIDLETDYQDNGWTISDGKAVHLPYNSGTLTIDAFRLSPSKSYVLSFSVTNYSSGSLKYIVGGEESEEITANGDYNRVVVSDVESPISFWSDGFLEVSNVVITDTEEIKETHIFNSDMKRYGGRRTYHPEIVSSFLDMFFSFKDGQMWKHNVNPVRNSFYGEVFDTEIKFVFNPEPTAVKNLSYIRLIGNQPWYIKEVLVRPRKGKRSGQLSRIKAGRFKNLQGQFFADFLKDMSDPRFTDRLKALFEGADLQGEIVEVTMSINSSDEVRLSAVDITYDVSMFSF